ncbi:hypothetical protein ACLOJK_015857 [Asimina triloba]
MGNLSLLLLISLSVFLFPFSSSAVLIPDDIRLPPDADLPAVHAQKLIRQLNLFPRDPEPARAVGLAAAPRIVEKRFAFPGLAVDSGASVEDLGHHAGYYRLSRSHDARMFYFFFESRNSKDDPVVIWLTGGPGCSSELAVFYENGPFTIANNLSLVWNPYGWDKVSNLLYVDQPTGTGFSFSSDERDFRHDELGISDDLYDFLQGFAIGNGLTDPAIQYKAYTDYALDMGIIKDSDYKRINKIVPRYYDIRKECIGDLCYDFSNMEKFLNQKKVRDALGVGDIDFVSCSPTVYQGMLTDWMRNLEVGIPTLVEDGIKLLVYAGEYDLICNWLGNSRWVHDMQWSGKEAFGAVPEASFMVDGVEAGKLKRYGTVSFLKVSPRSLFFSITTDIQYPTVYLISFVPQVHDAGHMVPMDQPKAALEMLKRWTKGKLAATSSNTDGAVADI